MVPGDSHPEKRFGSNLLKNKFAKSSKFLSPMQADRVLRNFAPSDRVLRKHGTHVASYGVFTENKAGLQL